MIHFFRKLIHTNFFNTQLNLISNFIKKFSSISVLFIYLFDLTNWFLCLSEFFA